MLPLLLPSKEAPVLPYRTHPRIQFPPAAHIPAAFPFHPSKTAHSHIRLPSLWADIPVHLHKFLFLPEAHYLKGSPPDCPLYEITLPYPPSLFPAYTVFRSQSLPLLPQSEEGEKLPQEAGQNCVFFFFCSSFLPPILSVRPKRGCPHIWFLFYHRIPGKRSKKYVHAKIPPVSCCLLAGRDGIFLSHTAAASVGI